MFLLPDKGVGGNDIQSIMFNEYWKIISDGVSGINGVISGLAVTSNANLSPSVAKGSVISNGIMYPVTAGTVVIAAANATNPRIDVIVVNASGIKTVRTGTAAVAPKPPTLTANDVAIASVFVAATTTNIGSSAIDDKRVLLSYPVVIYKTTTQEVTNTTIAAIHALNKAASGVVIPDGVLLTGRMLRVSLGGNMLLNSGTPTTSIAISFGGTTWFSDVTAVAAADIDRRAWNIDFVIAGQSSSVQHIVGNINLEVQAAVVTAPTTGTAGDIGGTTTATANINVPFEGVNGAVLADTGDRILTCTFTFNVSNVANELVTEYAIVELL